MMVLQKRLECECGALAVFVVLVDEEEEAEEGERNFSYTGWCQHCFEKAQEEVGEPE
jgi:hypothetical protein